MNTPGFCPKIKQLIVSFDLHPSRLSVARLRCKQWDCEYCGKKNASMWRAHLLDTLMKKMLKEQWVFVTLTAHKKTHAYPEISLKNLKDAWDHIYDDIRYKYKPKKIEYVYFFEQHKSGAYHMHMLINLGGEYDKSEFSISPELKGKSRVRREKRHPMNVWLAAAAASHGAGYVCHITRIMQGAEGGDNVRLAVGYVTKYMSKSVGLTGFPKRMRRVGTSRNIGSPQTKGKSGFNWHIKGSLTQEMIEYAPHYSLNHSRMLEASDCEGTGVYPPASE